MGSWVKKILWTLPLTALVLAGVFTILREGKRDQTREDIIKYVELWEYNLGKTLKRATDQELVEKVASGLKMYAISKYFVSSTHGQPLAEWPPQNSIATEECSEKVDSPISVNGFPVGKIVTCISDVKLTQQTLLSPLFLSLSLLALLTVGTMGALTLFGYRRALSNTIRALREWNTNSANAIQTKGFDKITTEIVELIKDGYESRVQLAETMIQLESSQEVAKITAKFAHDIRSPVSSLSSVLATVEGLPTGQQKAVDLLMKQISSVGENLLTQYRDKIRENLVAPVELGPIVEQIISEKKLLHPNVTFECRIFQIAFAKCSPEALKTILSNLINNSVDALPSSKGLVICAVSKIDGYSVVSVEDNGKGIPAEVLPNIFMENFTYGKEAGNGLGLFFAQSQIQTWNGQIQVSSAADTGTKFSIYLLDALNRSQKFDTSATESHAVSSGINKL